MTSVFKLYSNSILSYLEEELEEAVADALKHDDWTEADEVVQVLNDAKAMTSIEELIEFEMENQDCSYADIVDSLVNFIEKAEKEEGKSK